MGILMEEGVPFKHFDILEDDEVRQVPNDYIIVPSKN